MKVVKPKQPKQKRRKSKPFPKFILPLLLVVVFGTATLCLVLPQLTKKPPQQTNQYKGVVELWNVETFEGGSGSRSSWLTSRAAKFEQSHQGLFVHVTNLTVLQLTDKLDNGDTFDIICFSRGVGCLVQDMLQPYTGSVADVKSNMLLSGQVGNNVLALPLYAGSYCLFARENQLPQNCNLLATALSNTYTRKVGKTTYNLQPLACGFTPYNSPLSALAMSGGRGRVQVDESITQFAAYESFVANKTAVTLLGTQRDLFRLSQREENGKMDKLVYCPLDGYTDLVQYLAISSACTDKLDSCTEFLQFCISPTSQQTLVNINMFSVLEQTYYTKDTYLRCEQGLADAYVPNVFGDSQVVQAQRQTAISTLGF